VGSTNVSPSDGSSCATTLYSPESNVIFLVFKLIMAWFQMPNLIQAMIDKVLCHPLFLSLQNQI
jgi:hypothetical protein